MEKRPVILREWDDLGQVISEYLFADEAAADARIKNRKDLTVDRGGEKPYLSRFTKEFPGVVIEPDEQTF